MAISLISVKCPSCGADLSVEEEREVSFCSYCGTKVLINNENEHIFRNIDEAKIKEAETEQMVLMRQLDMEEKANTSKKYLIIIWIVAIAILVILGIIGLGIKNDGLIVCMSIAMIVGASGSTYLFGNAKKKKKVYIGPNSAAISEGMRNYKDKNYNSILLMFQGAGFTNVSAIPLKDLNFFKQNKNGQVETVSINGKNDFEKDDVFPKDSNVVIMYHSRG